jgi:SAM-dependent methyltransferase
LLPINQKQLTPERQPDFFPSLLSPFYFVRKGLQIGIRKYSHQLHGKLMDFGCGSKPYRSFFIVEEYIGVDFVNEGHPHDNEQIDVFYNGKTIPLPEAYFDSVLSSEVFEHIFNLEEVLKEINRVMKRGGKLLVTCPFVWNEHEVPNDYARYTRYALAQLLAKNGFEILEYHKTGNFVRTIFQLGILYWYHLLYPGVKKYLLLRLLYKAFFVFLPNISGIVISAVMPTRDSLYLNNVVLAKKI